MGDTIYHLFLFKFDTHTVSMAQSFLYSLRCLSYFLCLFHIWSRSNFLDNPLKHLKCKVLVLVGCKFRTVYNAADNTLAHMGFSNGICSVVVTLCYTPLPIRQDYRSQAQTQTTGAGRSLRPSVHIDNACRTADIQLHPPSSFVMVIRYT